MLKCVSVWETSSDEMEWQFNKMSNKNVGRCPASLIARERKNYFATEMAKVLRETKWSRNAFLKKEE